jgi:hypothetical protein
LIFCGDTGVIIKVRGLLEEALSSGLLGTPTLNKEPAQNIISEQPKEKNKGPRKPAFQRFGYNVVELFFHCQTGMICVMDGNCPSFWQKTSTFQTEHHVKTST